MSQPRVAVEPVVGAGGAQGDLSASELRETVAEALRGVPRASRVLGIIPDKTRDDNTDVLLPAAAEVLAARGVAEFDLLVAQGTHAPMTDSEKRLKIGADVSASFSGAIYDHCWDRAEELATIGTLDPERVRALTGDLLDRDVRLTINRRLAPGVYDYVIVFGATVPHEVAGFAGGAKYFFPGVSGPDLTHATHWLGALHGVEHTIGRIETPVRRMIEAAADFVEARIISLNSVVTREDDDDDRLRTRALFAGDLRGAFRRAAEVSKQVHIKYTGREFRRVVALLDEHYDEMWTGGKASYRLGGVIEEGGELIIYAPHLRRISDTHGGVIERYGYQPLAPVRELVAAGGELQNNLCVAAHLAHVAYAGRADDPTRGRFRITLASQVDEATCRRVNLGYMNPRDFRLADYEGDLDTLVVERAGRDLYLVAPRDDRTL